MRSERGHTLVEMVVVTALLSVVTSAAFGTVIVMQNQAARTSDRFAAQNEARTIADRITKDLRTAVSPSSTSAAFASASASDIVFYASLFDLSGTNPPGPTRLHAYTSLVSGTNVYAFHEDSTSPDAGGSAGNYTYTGTPISRIDGQFLDPSQSLFTFYAANSDTAIDPATLTTVSDLRSIESVGITLRVRVRPNAPTVVVQTRIHLRNVDYNPNA
ncbi:MAG: hypothetical protein JWM72_3185 [Actinomycetia bacterium]|nr:hypothetical protein [Actinomycetes bacterium]